jgi:hypothetical protein
MPACAMIRAVNKRVVFLLVLLAACSREKPAPPPAPEVAKTPPTVSSTPVASPPASSYEAALDRFRISPGFRFKFNDGEGSLKRPRQGMEQMKVHVASGAGRGDWTAEVKANGVVWTKDGKHTLDVPPALQRLYQRLTFFPDPQKKEGAAQRVGDRFEFTDANGGERYVITTGADGGFRQIRVGELTISIE